MNKLKSLTKPLLPSVFIAGIIFFLSVNAQSQVKYGIKLNLNDKELFTNCCKEGSKLYLPMEELALKIDGSVTIAGTFELGPYFKFEGSKVSLIKTGCGKDARLKVNKTGVLSSEVKIIIQGGVKHAFIDIESFSAALGGTWKYNESTGVYSVTAGGCGACLINET
jgi:hypothetical protein